MRIAKIELGIVGLLILYIAFGTHPAPAHIVDFLSTSVGKILMLGIVLYVTVYRSLIVGVFLALAFVLTVQQVTEYLDPKEQTPKKEAEQPKSSGVPPPAVTGALASMLKKGDVRLPQVSQKKGTHTEKPPVSMSTVKPSAKSVEHFASF